MNNISGLVPSIHKEVHYSRDLIPWLLSSGKLGYLLQDLGIQVLGFKPDWLYGMTQVWVRLFKKAVFQETALVAFLYSDFGRFANEKYLKTSI